MGVCAGALGSCAGSCLAVCCCKVITKGSVTSTEAARWLLFWIQVVTGLLALVASNADLPGRMMWPCTALGSTGLCACGSNDGKCFSEQLVYRVCAAGFVVFLVQLLMAASGCIEGASKKCPVGKLIAVPILSMGFLFLPNDVFTKFSFVASLAAFVFMGWQAVLLVDFAHMWNDNWTLNANTAGRNFNHNEETAWFAAIVLMSIALLLLSISGIIYLYVDAFAPGVPALLVTTVTVGFVLLVVSITEWCEHGNLLTSALVFMYLTWLCASALAVMPSVGPAHKPSTWLLLIFALLFGLLSLLDLATGAANKENTASGETLPLTIARGAANKDKASSGETNPAETVDVNDFMWQCGAHAAAPVYLCSMLAPMSSWASFWARVAGLAASASIYGWILVAPKVLTNRTFL